MRCIEEADLEACTSARSPFHSSSQSFPRRAMELRMQSSKAPLLAKARDHHRCRPEARRPPRRTHRDRRAGGTHRRDAHMTDQLLTKLSHVRSDGCERKVFIECLCLSRSPPGGPYHRDNQSGRMRCACALKSRRQRVSANPVDSEELL